MTQLLLNRAPLLLKKRDMVKVRSAVKHLSGIERLFAFGDTFLVVIVVLLNICRAEV